MVMVGCGLGSGEWRSRCVSKHFIALSNHSPTPHHSPEQPVGKMEDNVSNPVWLTLPLHRDIPPRRKRVYVVAENISWII